MSDEQVIKTSKNCTMGMSPGTLTLTGDRLQFATILRKKLKVDLPLTEITGVKPFGGNILQVETVNGGFVRIQVNITTRKEWIDAIEEAISR